MSRRTNRNKIKVYVQSAAGEVMRLDTVRNTPGITTDQAAHIAKNYRFQHQAISMGSTDRTKAHTLGHR